MRLPPLLLSLCLTLGSQLSAASSYDATASFSTVSNPNGVWVYGYSTAGEPSYNFAPFADIGIGVLGPYWHRASYGTFPVISLNQTSSTFQGIQPGQLYLHPGPAIGADLAILRFVAPVSDTYSVTGQFFAGASGSMSGAVYRNGALLQAFSSTTDGSVFTFSPVTLASGGTIDFVVGNNGNFNFGATPITVVVSNVPEPATAFLLLAGAAALFARRRHANY